MRNSLKLNCLFAEKALKFSTFSYYTPILVRRLRESQDLSSVISNHSKILKRAAFNVLTGNHLINAYLRCGNLGHAQKVFDEMSERNVVSWTSLMAGYIDGDRPELALSHFRDMFACSVWPNSFTFATAINACAHLADLRRGQEIHARVEALGLHLDLVVATSLIGMYGKTTDIGNARRVFDKMTNKNIITWCSMVSAYAQNACGYDALALFGEFLRLDMRPSHFMLSSLVNACASIGRLSSGRSIHALVVRHDHEGNEVIAGALIDMYSKCGCIDYSNKVFHRIQQPSLVPYTSMIVAAAKYGQAKVSLNLFDQMLDRGIRPNSVTLLGVLHACTHSGLVSTGLTYLKSMHKDHGIAPNVKHYTCAVDMLGRAGRLDEACELSKEFQAEGEDVLLLWSTLLSASRIHKRLDIVLEAEQRLVGFDRDVAGAYVAMSNTYASAGEWSNAVKVRTEMSRRGIRKDPGCSWIEIKDMVYVFYAGEVTQCARRTEVVKLLRELEVRMEERGYVNVNRNFKMEFDETELGMEDMLGIHSERLALGFGLISIPKGMTIRVMKNLRMCRDCHDRFKMISDIVGRDFVVRDLNRFHHFTAGVCACGDYW